MTEQELHALRYPIGEFGEYRPKTGITEYDVRRYISIIDSFPAQLRKKVETLNDSQLDTTYRDGGWTVRQVVHHVVDSHINSYTRFKLTLTEDKPVIRPYYEDRWAELPEAKTAPVSLSLPLLDSLHKRWAVMLKNINSEQLKLRFYHPENKTEMALDELICHYAWHCEHHLAHITRLKERMNW